MFVHDETLGLHISTTPLLISSRVLKAAKSIDPDLRLTWDKHGFVCGVSHDIATKLSKALGIRMLNVREMMELVRRHPQLRTEDFCEWLSDTYQYVDAIELPTPARLPTVLHEDRSTSRLTSSDGSVQFPIARPGWFHLDDLCEDGLPKKLSPLNEPGHWKFWSPESKEHTLGALRGFVSSSGTCSLDLGMPTIAQHPKIMIRECYEKLAAPCTSELDSLWPTYEKLNRSRDAVALKDFLNNLDLGNITLGDPDDEFVHHRNQERLVDLRGKKCLLNDSSHNMTIIGESNLLETLQHTPDNETRFIIGHPHPDADSIVSSIFEALRQCLAYTRTGSLPWSESMPREVQYILGPEITALMSRIHAPKATNTIVLVDCHKTLPEYQTQVRAVVDHHILDTNEFPHYVALTHEVCWATTLQVYIKILGSGFDLSPGLAKILLEATRLEAEPALLNHMGELDRLTIQRLESICSNKAASYAQLMSVMVDTTDPSELFYRDYRQTSYGFSVVKCKELIDFRTIAESNNIKHCLPLTVVKSIVYSTDFHHVISETIALITNPGYHDKGFQDILVRTVEAACQAFHGKEPRVRGDDVIMEDNPTQVPRLLLQPLIETLVKEHVRFRYSSVLDRYISKGYYSGTSEVYGKPGEDAIVRTGISFVEVKNLLKTKKSTSFLTLPDYWKVFHEMQDRGEISALQSLQDERYVEHLDTFIPCPSMTIHGSSPATEVTFEEARPALINPADGNEVTGLPNIIQSPDNYGDKNLWRYWAPDTAYHGQGNVATRGHIFVMGQTSIDLKVRPEEATKQMTFRPVYKDIPDMKVELEEDLENNWIRVKVFPRIFGCF